MIPFTQISKIRIDQLPKIIYYQKWDYKEYIPYLEWRYGKKIKPVQCRNECDIDDSCTCPRCNAPETIPLIKTRVPKGSSSVKYSSTAFSPEEKRFARPYPLKCPYCSHSLVSIKKQKTPGYFKLNTHPCSSQYSLKLIFVILFQIFYQRITL